MPAGGELFGQTTVSVARKAQNGRRRHYRRQENSQESKAKSDLHIRRTSRGYRDRGCTERCRQYKTEGWWEGRRQL